MLKKRKQDSNKGDYGKVLIVAGSKGMAGAAALAALAALRSGSGLVRVSIDASLFTAIHAIVPEATCVIRGEERFEEYQAVAIGPGIGMDFDLPGYLTAIEKSGNIPVLLDADALNIIAGSEVDADSRIRSDRNIAEYKMPKVLTPHPGEAGRLLGCPASEINADREEAAVGIAKMTESVCVLKGNGTITADPKGRIKINTTGNPGMATAGSGDVLSGIITSFLGQGMNIFDAAEYGTYIHGLAGDAARDELGEYGMIAGDIIRHIPHAIIKSIESIDGGER